MKIVVIGAGASGIVAGICSKRSDNEVIVLEQNKTPLKKLLITGNGKCNYFNEDFDIKHYESSNIDLLKEVITEDNKKKVLDFMNRIGIIPKIKNGYYYPASNQAYTIHNALLKEASVVGVKVMTDTKVEEIKYNDKFILKTNNEEIICDKLIISTGSKAYPKTGSTGDGYIFASKLNHKINEVNPSLVQLTSSNKILKELEGVRSDVKVSLYDDKLLKEETGEIQFTSYGLSGICIYNLSILLNKTKNPSVGVNLLSEYINNYNDFIKLMDLRNNSLKERTITELLESYLNYKIVNALLKLCKIDNNVKWNELSKDKKELLGQTLTDLRFDITGTKGYEASQVCSGGVSLEDINIETFESKKIPNLYFTGELLDVCGECGGYNLGFAFLSGIIVGMNIND